MQQSTFNTMCAGLRVAVLVCLFSRGQQAAAFGPHSESFPTYPECPGKGVAGNRVVALARRACAGLSTHGQHWHRCRSGVHALAKVSRHRRQPARGSNVHVSRSDASALVAGSVHIVMSDHTTGTCLQSSLCAADATISAFTARVDGVHIGGKFPPTYLGGVQYESPRSESDPSSAGVLGEVKTSWPASPPYVDTPYVSARWNKTGWDPAIQLLPVALGEGLQVNVVFRTDNVTQRSHFFRTYFNRTAVLSVSVGRSADGKTQVSADVLASGTMYMCSAEINETIVATKWTTLTASCAPLPFESFQQVAV